MVNIVLITSVINTPNKPLSYSKIRSLYSRQERFEQTKKTLTGLKHKWRQLTVNKYLCVEFITKNYTIILLRWKNETILK